MIRPANRPGPRAVLPLVRCAIYTRKSTEEGLEQEFNSLDAQREAAEAFIRSQAGEGWAVLPQRYDDGGFTGGNLDRPALQRLLADIAAGKIDCVVIYKVDRLSRSLLDFARLMELFERQRVSFVSITQQFNSATSMGRLVLNVLLSFAQFEREIIAERTRDKIAATRRKGKWSAGRPLLGFDVDPRSQRLLVNPQEAERVRVIFALFVEYGSLPPVLRALESRGWVNKRWQTRSGRDRGGEPFTRVSLRRLLSNVLYAGQVRYKDEVHQGEQPALVDPAVFRRAQELLHNKERTGGVPARGGPGALLRGLLRCAPCGCAMTPTHAARGARCYRYYTCTRAQKRGWHLPLQVGPRRRHRTAGARTSPRPGARPGAAAPLAGPGASGGGGPHGGAGGGAAGSRTGPGGVAGGGPPAGAAPSARRDQRPSPCPACGWKPTVMIVCEVIVDRPEQARALDVLLTEEQQ